ncbi:hypothetical protein UFOVP225_80 [uncultured Caudovirales phage]|uniref:Uncharacterized protein n=1 Tax=uncultured Caudovirales phage TaxID=2100421 RepID=A0A6J7WRZ0_9CAUD|nr:hypothetical protein UFOVP113_93 [uncultured Caudovirales phage]CAB5219512.1 hypothetical protein UFOVP225_80 [uncultured Caudovirales phage]
MTIDEVKAELEQRVIDHSESMERAEADGNSDYDYYMGLVDAYECVVSMLNQLDKESI